MLARVERHLIDGVNTSARDLAQYRATQPVNDDTRIRELGEMSSAHRAKLELEAFRRGQWIPTGKEGDLPWPFGESDTDYQSFAFDRGEVVRMHPSYCFMTLAWQPDERSLAIEAELSGRKNARDFNALSESTRRDYLRDRDQALADSDPEAREWLPHVFPDDFELDPVTAEIRYR